MSGTPKRTAAWYKEQERLRIAAEQEQLRLEEEARRAAEQVRLAEERRQKLLNEGRQVLREAQSTLAGIAGGEAAKYLSAAQQDELARLVEQAAQAIASVPDESAARSAVGIIRQTAARVQRKADAVAAVQQSTEQLTDEVAGMKGQLHDLAGDVASRFVPDGSFGSWESDLDECTQLPTPISTEHLRAARGRLQTVQNEVRQAASRAASLHMESANVTSALQELERSLSVFASSDSAMHAGSGALGKLEAAVQKQHAELGLAKNRDGIQAVRRAAASLADDIRGTEAAAKATRLAMQLEKEDRELTEIRGLVEGLDPARSQKFDGAGWQGLQSCLTEGRTRLDAKQIEPARQQLALARSQLDVHYRTVADGFSVWQHQRDEAGVAVGDTASRLASLRDDPARSRWVVGGVAEAGKRMSDAQKAFDREEFAEATRLAHLAGLQLSQLAQRADDLAAESLRLADLRQETSLAQPVPGRTFNSTGAADLTRCLSAAAEALRLSQLDEARRSLNLAEERLSSHREAARLESELWQQEHEKIDGKLGAIEGRLESMRGCPVAGKWRRDGIAAQAGKIEQARKAVAAGRFTDAHRLVDQVATEADRLQADANRLEGKTQDQARLADSVEQAMRELGFDMNRGPEQPNDPQSAMILAAWRANGNGDEMVVSVNQDCKIEYFLEGKLKESMHKTKTTERVGNREKSVQHCDTPGGELQQFLDILYRLGWENDGVNWDDDPDDKGVQKVEKSEEGRGTVRKPDARHLGADRWPI